MAAVGAGLFLLLFHGGSTKYSATPPFVIAILWILVLWGGPWWAARVQYTKQPSAQGPRTMTLDDSGVHLRWETGESKLEWRVFMRWVESKDQFLLYSSPKCFNMLPKRALTPEQLAEFRVLLKAKIACK